MNPRTDERKGLGLSQQAAAAYAGVGLATWRRWEEDPESVKASTRRICELALVAYREALKLGLDMTKPATPDPYRLVTVPQVAARLACSRSHVYRLIEDGQLRSVDIGTATRGRRKTRLFAQDVEEFIAAREVASRRQRKSAADI